MDYKKISIFTVAYFVISMAWAFPWHMVWFHNLYVEWGAVTRAEPIIPLGITAMLTQGVVIGYLYSFYYQQTKGHPILKGIKFNLIIGLMIYTVMGFATAAKFQIEPVTNFLLYHTIFQTVQFVLTGAALGFIFRQPSPTREENYA